MTLRTSQICIWLVFFADLKEGDYYLAQKTTVYCLYLIVMMAKTIEI